MQRITQRWLLVLLGTVLATGILGAAAPPPQVAPKAIQQQINRLGDRDFAIRHRAHQQLLQMGPQVLPRLMPHLSSPEIETRRRLMQLVQQLEQERDLAPSRVTATFHNAPLDQVFEKIHWQTGLKTRWLPGDTKPPRFTGRFQNATYWEAMEQIAQQTSSTPQFSQELINPQIESFEIIAGLMPIRRPARHVYSHGAFRLQAVRISQQGDRNLLDEDEQESTTPSINISMQIMCEARMSILHLESPRILSARDDKGRSLVPASQRDDDAVQEAIVQMGRIRMVGFRGNLGGMRGSAMGDTVLSLDRPHPEARHIAEVRGVVPAQVVAGHRIRTVLKGITRGANFEVMGQTQEISNIWTYTRGNITQYQIRSKSLPAINGDDEMRMMDIYSLSMLLEFQDEDGRVCPSELTGSLFAGTLLQVMPSTAGKRPARILLREPVTRGVELPFEFRDLPLP